MNNNLKGMYSSGNDEMYTPKILVEPIIPYIPTGSTVWCPCDTKSSEFVLTLREHDINVIHSHIWEGKDFLTYEPEEHYDCIITNPPFSLKLDVFKRLVSLQKPFAILMNSTCEQYQVIGNYFWELSKKGIHIQKLTPAKRLVLMEGLPVLIQHISVGTSYQETICIVILCITMPEDTMFQVVCMKIL